MAAEQQVAKYQIHDRSVRAGIHSPRHRMSLLRMFAEMDGLAIDREKPTTVLDSIVAGDAWPSRVLDAGVTATLQRGENLVSTIEHISGYRHMVVPNLVTATAQLLHNLTKEGGLLYRKPVVAQANVLVHGVGASWRPLSFAEALGTPEDMLDVCFSPRPYNVLNMRQYLYSWLETEYSEEEFIERAYWTSRGLLRAMKIDDVPALRFLRALQYYLEEGDLHAYQTILYYLSGNIDEPERLEDLKAKVLTPRQLEEIKMNAGTKMILDAETRILNQARAESKAEGRAEAMAEAVLRFVRGKFGSVPKQLEARLDATPAEELNGWIDRVLSATSLDELLGSGGGRTRRSPA